MLAALLEVPVAQARKLQEILELGLTTMRVLPTLMRLGYNRLAAAGAELGQQPAQPRRALMNDEHDDE